MLKRIELFVRMLAYWCFYWRKNRNGVMWQAGCAWAIAVMSYDGRSQGYCAKLLGIHKRDVWNIMQKYNIKKRVK